MHLKCVYYRKHSAERMIYSPTVSCNPQTASNHGHNIIQKHIKIKVSIIFLKGIHFNTQILWYTAFYLWPTDLAKIPCNLLNFCIFHYWTLNCHNSVNLLARSPKFCMVVDHDNINRWWQWSWWWWWQLWW